MGVKGIEEGYEVNVPDKCPDNLEDAMEMLGNVKYAAWGHSVFFMHKDQSSFTGGWAATYRNAARFSNPETKSETRMEACQKMHAFLLQLKKEGKKI
jgi:hypothetical protein